MAKEIEIPEGYEAKIDGNKVILVPKESEDERIRKELISFVNKYYGEETKKEVLAYLEKLKEQKPEIKYVYPKFRKGDVIEPITPNGHCMPVRVVDIWNGSYSCRSDDDKAYLSLPIRNEDEYRLAEQKPAEWSEEDEFFRQQLIVYCENCVQDTLAAKCVAWLKSLSSQSHWKPSEEQMKCLEDCVNRAREIYNTSTSGYDAYPTLSSLYNYLKSL